MINLFEPQGNKRICLSSRAAAPRVREKKRDWRRLWVFIPHASKFSHHLISRHLLQVWLCRRRINKKTEESPESGEHTFPVKAPFIQISLYSRDTSDNMELLFWNRGFLCVSWPKIKPQLFSEPHHDPALEKQKRMGGCYLPPACGGSENRTVLGCFWEKQCGPPHCK